MTSSAKSGSQVLGFGGMNASTGRLIGAGKEKLMQPLQGVSLLGCRGSPRVSPGKGGTIYTFLSSKSRLPWQADMVVKPKAKLAQPQKGAAFCHSRLWVLSCFDTFPIHIHM